MKTTANISASWPNRAILCALALAFTFSGSDVKAGIKLYTGPTGGQWLNAANWTPTGSPSGEDSVVITGLLTSDSVNLATSTITIKNLTMSSAAGLTMTDGGDLKVTDRTVMDHNSALSIYALTGSSIVRLGNMDSFTNVGLSGGAFFLFASEGQTATLRINNAGLHINGGGIFLNGQGSSITNQGGDGDGSAVDAIDGVIEVNQALGSLFLSNKTLNTNTAGFDNAGFVEAGAQGVLNVTNASNLSGGWLSNYNGTPSVGPSEWAVRDGGIINFTNASGSLAGIDANVTVRIEGAAGGEFRNANGDNMLSDLGQVNGSLVVAGGAHVTVGNSIYLDGGNLIVKNEHPSGSFTGESKLEVQGGITSISSGWLYSGNLTSSNNNAGTSSTLQATGLYITGIGAGTSVTLDGVNSNIVDENGTDALRDLSYVQGTFSVLNGRDFATSGSLYNEGTIRVLGGSTLTVNGDFTQSITGRVILGEHGNSAVVGHMLVNGNITINGSLQGTGDITGILNTSGIVSPGFSPGRIDVNGALNFTSSTVTLFELAGTDQGTSYDFINVYGTPGTWLLDGQINIAFWGGFENLVTASDVFQVGYAAGGMSGSFLNLVSGDRLMTVDGYGSFVVTYGTGNQILLTDYMAVVPEPGSAALVVLTLGGAFLARRRRPVQMA